MSVPPSREMPATSFFNTRSVPLSRGTEAPATRPAATRTPTSDQGDRQRQDKVDRLTGAYTDRALNLADYKRRRADIESNAERPLRRLAELDAAPAEEPAAPVVRSFADTWPTLNIDGDETWQVRC